MGHRVIASFGLILALTTCSKRERGYESDQKPLGVSSLQVGTAASALSRSQPVTSLSDTSTQSSSTKSLLHLSGITKEVIVNDFILPVPVEWVLRAKPNGRQAFFNGDTVFVSIYCPIPGWDAGLGWGESHSLTREFTKAGRRFQVTFESYPLPAYVLYMHPADLEVGEGSSPSCAFIAAQDYPSMQRIFDLIR